MGLSHVLQQALGSIEQGATEASWGHGGDADDPIEALDRQLTRMSLYRTLPDSNLSYLQCHTAAEQLASWLFPDDDQWLTRRLICKLLFVADGPGGHHTALIPALLHSIHCDLGRAANVPLPIWSSIQPRKALSRLLQPAVDRSEGALVLLPNALGQYDTLKVVPDRLEQLRRTKGIPPDWSTAIWLRPPANATGLQHLPLPPPHPPAAFSTAQQQAGRPPTDLSDVYWSWGGSHPPVPQPPLPPPPPSITSTTGPPVLHISAHQQGSLPPPPHSTGNTTVPQAADPTNSTAAQPPYPILQPISSSLQPSAQEPAPVYNMSSGSHTTRDVLHPALDRPALTPHAMLWAGHGQPPASQPPPLVPISALRALPGADQQPVVGAMQSPLAVRAPPPLPQAGDADGQPSPLPPLPPELQRVSTATPPPPPPPPDVDMVDKKQDHAAASTQQQAGGRGGRSAAVAGGSSQPRGRSPVCKVERNNRGSSRSNSRGRHRGARQDRRRSSSRSSSRGKGGRHGRRRSSSRRRRSSSRSSSNSSGDSRGWRNRGSPRGGRAYSPGRRGAGPGPATIIKRSPSPDAPLLMMYDQMPAHAKFISTTGSVPLGPVPPPRNPNPVPFHVMHAHKSISAQCDQVYGNSTNPRNIIMKAAVMYVDALSKKRGKKHPREPVPAKKVVDKLTTHQVWPQLEGQLPDGGPPWFKTHALIVGTPLFKVSTAPDGSQSVVLDEPMLKHMSWEAGQRARHSGR